MIEVPGVHTSRGARPGCHQRNLSLDLRHESTMGLPEVCTTSGHQRNHSLDSVLQCIPEDNTPTSPEYVANNVYPQARLPSNLPTGSDDSGILCALATAELDQPPDTQTEATRTTYVSEHYCDFPSTASSGSDYSKLSCTLDSTEPNLLPDIPVGLEVETLNAQSWIINTGKKLNETNDVEPDSDPDAEEKAMKAATARSRESLDSGNPEDVETQTLQSSPPRRESKSTVTYSKSGEDNLLRMFKSEMFNMSMAICYFFKCNDVGVRTYLANKLFSFPPEDVDFYLPQLATMFIEMDENMAESLRPYFVHRCKQSADFSLRLVWLLTAFTGVEQSRVVKLRDSIIAEKIRNFTTKKGHYRSHSDASALRVSTSAGRCLGDLTSGRAFDNGCTCGEQCGCGAPRLEPQTEFVNALTGIGRRLAAVTDKEKRKTRLREQLTILDLNLPAKVSLPLHKKPHYVLRIPPHAAAVLNSKDKAPYVIYVEVLEIEGSHTSLPARLLPPPPQAPLSPPIRNTKSEENLVSEWRPLSTYTGFDVLDLSECWSPEDDEVSLQYPTRRTAADALSLSTASVVSGSSAGSRDSAVVRAREVRMKLADATAPPPPNTFTHDPVDPSAQVMKESWESKLARIRSSSPYGALPGWRLLGCIVKVGDDLRQELLASQILKQLSLAWSAENLPLRLQLYEIVCLDKDSGFIQPVLNSVSLHQIKFQSKLSLRKWLELEHGPPTSEGFLAAQRNFVESVAAYAVTSYLLQLKDRHNGNILLDSAGHIIHIDFGFMLSTSPKNLGFESSPFKLTSEFVEVMDGETSDMFAYFKILILKGLKAATKHMDNIILIVEVMKTGGQIACLHSEDAVESLRKRFHGNLPDEKLAMLVDTLVSNALNSKSTKLYDYYQYSTNGIL